MIIRNSVMLHSTMIAAATAWALIGGTALSQGASQLQVVNATALNVEVRVTNALGVQTVFEFTNGQGQFEPVPLRPGLGDRVVSVRRINADGTVILPSKVLAMSKFDPADATQPILKLTFVSGIAGYDIVYTTAATPEAVGEAVVVKGEPKDKNKLSAEQSKAVEEALRMKATRFGGI